MRSHDLRIRQRWLVGRRLRLADREVDAKYVFPFVRGDWSVDFEIVDILGIGPRSLESPVARDGDRLVSPASFEDLRRIETRPTEGFDRVVHFDPWWVFRGVSGVASGHVRAILATNIARPFPRDGIEHKVHDLALSADGIRLEEIVVKDAMFHPRILRAGEVDLLALRRPGKTL